MNRVPATVSRAPRGVDTKRPILVRLLPSERAAVEQLAEREQRSLGSMCRLVLLRGLAVEQPAQPLRS